MSAMREKDQADFDLERFIDMFDEAMTSSDPRVIETLRSLMMIVTLTRSETRMNHGRNNGPLRRLYEDLNDLNRRMHRLEEDVNQSILQQRKKWPLDSEVVPWDDSYNKYSLTASQSIAAQIDQDVLNRVTGKINTGGAFPAKGLLKK